MRHDVIGHQLLRLHSCANYRHGDPGWCKLVNEQLHSVSDSHTSRLYGTMGCHVHFRCQFMLTKERASAAVAAYASATRCCCSLLFFKWPCQMRAQALNGGKRSASRFGRRSSVNFWKRSCDFRINTLLQQIMFAHFVS